MTWIHFLWNLYSQLTMGFEKQSKCTKECKCLQGQRGDSHWLQTIFLAWIPLVASMDWKWLCDQTFLHPGIFRDSNFNTQTIHLGSQWICRFWMSRSGWAPRFFTAKRIPNIHVDTPSRGGEVYFPNLLSYHHCTHMHTHTPWVCTRFSDSYLIEYGNGKPSNFTVEKTDTYGLN